MTIEARTVTSILSAGSDSVTLINSINTDASSVQRVEGMTQAEINEVVQANVDHIVKRLLMLQLLQLVRRISQLIANFFCKTRRRLWMKNNFY